MISKSRRRLAAQLARRRTRERAGLALAEGPRVAMEALEAPVEVAWALLGDSYAGTDAGRGIAEACRAKGVALDRAADGDVRRLCTTETPQPVILAVRTPPLERRSLARGRFLLADGVQTPGNLGALVRSARGFGLNGVVIGAGTADPWNPKAVRASAGAAFRMSFLGLPAGFPEDGSVPSLLYADAGGAPVGAASAREAGGPSWVLAVGGEGNGVSEGVRRAGRGLAVPLAPGVESLNVAVAGSILMYLLTRAAAVVG